LRKIKLFVSDPRRLEVVYVVSEKAGEGGFVIQSLERSTPLGSDACIQCLLYVKVLP